MTPKEIKNFNSIKDRNVKCLTHKFTQTYYCITQLKKPNSINKICIIVINQL